MRASGARGDTPALGAADENLHVGAGLRDLSREVSNLSFLYLTLSTKKGFFKQGLFEKS